MLISKIDDFLTKGYAIFSVPKMLNPCEFNIVNIETTEVNLNGHEKYLLKNFAVYVGENFVKPLFPTYSIKNTSIWEGVDNESTKWHNDSIEGFDFNVLYYFDTMSKYTGGTIEFKHIGGEEIIYPKTGDLIFINQDIKFKHRAKKSLVKRRVASIEFKK